MARRSSGGDGGKLSEETRESPWYAPGLRFNCTQCGGCCTGPTGFVWFDETEAAALAAHLGLTVRAFRERYAVRKHGRWSLREIVRDGMYDCVFLETDDSGRRGCGVYAHRPTQCRTWPFWPSNLQTPADWAEAAASCPGMEVPEAYRSEQETAQKNGGASAGGCAGGGCGCGTKGDGPPSGNAGGFVPVEAIRIELARNPDGL